MSVSITTEANRSRAKALKVTPATKPAARARRKKAAAQPVAAAVWAQELQDLKNKVGPAPSVTLLAAAVKQADGLYSTGMDGDDGPVSTATFAALTDFEEKLLATLPVNLDEAALKLDYLTGKIEKGLDLNEEDMEAFRALARDLRSGALVPKPQAQPVSANDLLLAQLNMQAFQLLDEENANYARAGKLEWSKVPEERDAFEQMERDNEALGERQDDLLRQMAKTPADGALGIAAKAVHVMRGGIYGWSDPEREVNNSLDDDIARLFPDMPRDPEPEGHTAEEMTEKTARGFITDCVIAHVRGTAAAPDPLSCVGLAVRIVQAWNDFCHWDEMEVVRDSLEDRVREARKGQADNRQNALEDLLFSTTPRTLEDVAALLPLLVNRIDWTAASNDKDEAEKRREAFSDALSRAFVTMARLVPLGDAYGIAPMFIDPDKLAA